MPLPMAPKLQRCDPGADDRELKIRRRLSMVTLAIASGAAAMTLWAAIAGPGVGLVGAALLLGWSQLPGL